MLFKYSTKSSLSLRAKKNVKKTTVICRAIVGKSKIICATELTKEFAIFDMNEESMEPTSEENCSEANKEGKIDWRGLTKSICCVAWNKEKDWLSIIGVKNHIGRIMMTSKSKTIIPAEIFFEGTYLSIKSYTGVKIKARIKPTIIEIKTGLSTKIANTVKSVKRITVAVFLKTWSDIL